MVDNAHSQDPSKADGSTRDDVDWTILESVSPHPGDLVRFVVEKTGLSRQAVNKRVSALVEEGLLEASGATKARQYRWRPLVRVPLSDGLSEDRIWRESLAPRLGDVSANVRAILQYGTTEMINNVIDHSDASELVVLLKPLEDDIEIYIEDNGEGFTQKLVRELRLENAQHALLELSKGKLTTDPDNHTGEGIFFTCRMCDKFMIWSRDICLMRIEGSGFFVLDAPESRPGTTVRMIVRRDTERTPGDVFDQFASAEDDYGFTRTAVSVVLARYEGETLVSRSQARRLLARGDQFREIHLDFRGLEVIGPAFADEVFRVYQREHPRISLSWDNATDEVTKMIRKVERAFASESGSK